MKRILCAAAVCAFINASVAGVLRAQEVGPRVLQLQEREQRQPSPLRPLRVAKWTTLVGSAGAAAYGFITNGRADDRFRELERACESDPGVCRERLPDGRYRDERLEAGYQEVLDLDRRARTALIAGQLGIAASVVLFLIDLGNERRPPDIPYAPKLDVRPGKDGAVQVGFSWTAPRLP